ncbi:MAG: HDOD domain-containing protein [Planctomycetota bacterium]
MSLWSRLLDLLNPGRVAKRATRASLAEIHIARAQARVDAGEVPAEVPEVQHSVVAAEVETEMQEQAQKASELQQLQASIPPALPQRSVFAQHERDESMAVILEGPEEEILWSIARRIESGRLDLPSLPSTSMAVIDLANNPSVEFHALVDQVSMDPVLSSELLRTANSVLYASVEPIDTLQSAITRIGLRALRSMIFSVSMRGTIPRSGVMAEYADEVWRQSYSVAMIARAIAPAVGVDPEKAFLLGLLQDIGKISLLSMLSKEVKDPRGATVNLVGHVFQMFHQEAGAAMARKWKLPAEFISVAGCHHEWADNDQHTRSAALANLAYRLDLAFTMGDPEFLAKARELPALLYLAPHQAARARILELARATYASSSSPESSASAASVGSVASSPEMGGA